MKASIIIPVYNAKKTIKSCLDSLIRQDFSKDKYEIICVDDGSTDDSVEIMKSFQSEIPIKIITKENAGPAVARNIGAFNANGEIILFTDSDCELDSIWLEEMIKPFADERVGGVQGVYRTKQKELISLLDQIDIECRYKKMGKNKYIDSIGTYSAAYRRKLFIELGGFNVNYKTACGEDFEFSFLVSKNGYNLVLAENAFCYHRHPETLMKYLRTKFIRGYWRTLLYKNNKDKILNDTYTSSIMKLQYIVVVFSLFSLLISLINTKYLIVSLGVLGIFWILCIPFVLFASSKNLTVALISPFVLFLRAIFFIAGMSLGIISVFSGKLK